MVAPTLTAAYFNFVAASRRTTISTFSFDINSRRQFERSFQKPEKFVNRNNREELMKAARRREKDAIVVWKLDRWGRSLHDLVATLQELGELQVGFVSITED